MTQGKSGSTEWGIAMTPTATDLTKSLAAEVDRFLAGGIDPGKCDALLGHLFDLATARGQVSLAVEERSLRFSSRGMVLLTRDDALAKKKGRMLCARLMVRCGEWTKRPVAPYGDQVDFEYPGNAHPCHVQFVNTTAAHEFAIQFDAASANGE